MPVQICVWRLVLSSGAWPPAAAVRLPAEAGTTADQVSAAPQGPGWQVHTVDVQTGIL
jgi:hypothetical protein